MVVDSAVLRDLLGDLIVAGRVRDDGDELEVLGSGADHGGAADVDVLDGFGEGDVRLGDGLFERIEVDGDEVDTGDVVLFHLADVLGVVADGEDAAVDVRVEGLDAAVHDLGEAGDVADVGDGDAGLFDGLHRAARGDDLDAGFVEFAGEVDDALFVRYADESAFDLHGFYLFLFVYISQRAGARFFGFGASLKWPTRISMPL